ncbi:hypothetical protein LMG24076_04970 [Trinickia soli]|nr:hypothetical protein LMG24076_04970 [Trinickia soli]
MPDAHVQEIENAAIIDTTIDQIAKSAAQNASNRNHFYTAQPGRTHQPSEQPHQNRENTVYEDKISSGIRHFSPEAQERSVVISRKSQKASSKKRHHLAGRQYVLE